MRDLCEHTNRVAISWRMSITSRAALRRTSTDACSAGIETVEDIVKVISCLVLVELFTVAVNEIVD